MKYLLILVIILCIKLFAREEEIFCATENSAVSQDKNTLLNTTYTLKILLVEFSDIKHDPKYTAGDFLTLFFSKWEYATPFMTSPDGEQVYGSVRDYYSLMSDGEFEITGSILNRDNDNDGRPEWLTLPYSKEYYHNAGRFFYDCEILAYSAGLDLSRNGKTKLCVIYAGHMYRGSRGRGLIPTSSNNFYIMSEKFAMGPPYDQERTDATFAGIGVHCHEFGHLLGWPDTYDYAQNNCAWTLMATGQYNNNTHAPAPVCPQFRIEKGWVTPVEINNNTTFYADYDLKDPEVFKICFTDKPDRYFLIENRSFTSKMNFKGALINDYNNYLPWNWLNNPDNLPEQGLLVWAFKKKLSNPADPRWSYLIQADGENNRLVKYNTSGNDPNSKYHTGDSGDPFPGYTGNMVFSPWSFPVDLNSGPSPSSYPSLNAGFEITEMGSDYIKVDLYCDFPERMRPQTPWYIDSLVVKNHPKMKWRANCEPDLKSYEIWKDGTFYKTVTDTSYTDISEITYTGYPQKKRYVDYNIVAKDSSGNTSFFSRTLTFLAGEKDNTTAVSHLDNDEKDFFLSPNSPNPFNPLTNITFILPEQSRVTLKVYNILGREVADLVNDIKPAGYYDVTFDGSAMASGVYVYTLIAKSLQSGKWYRNTRRMLLVK